jgi:flagellar biosynthesis/type III secretory pathway chaperone
MFDMLRGNLVRQVKGFELLSFLLEEEFSLLAERKPEEVSALEFSTHELIRQLADERGDMIKMMNGVRLNVFAEALPEEDGAEVRQILKELDALEQRCGRQGSRNAELALALHDQNQEAMDFLHSRLVQPKPQQTYNKMGTCVTPKAEAAIIRGRL